MLRTGLLPRTGDEDPGRVPRPPQPAAHRRRQAAQGLPGRGQQDGEICACSGNTHVGVLLAHVFARPKRVLHDIPWFPRVVGLPSPSAGVSGQRQPDGSFVQAATLRRTISREADKRRAESEVSAIGRWRLCACASLPSLTPPVAQRLKEDTDAAAFEDLSQNLHHLLSTRAQTGDRTAAPETARCAALRGAVCCVRCAGGLTSSASAGVYSSPFGSEFVPTVREIPVEEHIRDITMVRACGCRLRSCRCARAHPTMSRRVEPRYRQAGDAARHGRTDPAQPHQDAGPRRHQRQRRPARRAGRHSAAAAAATSQTRGRRGGARPAAARQRRRPVAGAAAAIAARPRGEDVKRRVRV